MKCKQRGCPQVGTEWQGQGACTETHPNLVHHEIAGACREFLHWCRANFDRVRRAQIFFKHQAWCQGNLGLALGKLGVADFRKPIAKPFRVTFLREIRDALHSSIQCLSKSRNYACDQTNMLTNYYSFNFQYFTKQKSSLNYVVTC